MKYRAFAALLLRQMQQWESAQGKRATLQGFADHLHVSQPLLSIWLKGDTKPSPEKNAFPPVSSESRPSDP